MDQTLTYYELCRHKAAVKGVPCLLDKRPDLSERRSKVDAASQAYEVEAKAIYSHIAALYTYLLSIRPAYLSMSTRTPLSPSTTFSGAQDFPFYTNTKRSLTNAQRDEIDYESRQIIQQCTTRVRRLEQVESQRLKMHDDAPILSKFLRDPKAEGRMATIVLHRRGVTQFLNHLLKVTSEMQTDLQEVRVAREAERAKSRLNNVSGKGMKTNNVITVEQMLAAEEEQDQVLAQAPPELLRELEDENSALLAEFQETLEQAQQAEKSLYEIAALHGELAMHLAQQEETTQQLYDEAVQTIGSVESANTQLEKARKRNRTASKLIIFMSLFLAFFLLFIDYASR
ncbi:hypothetical protein V1512DRAFT_269783 [Lipomyces arxii]|uniref:uncharacterized protein n=1 Tax=Lipomyces arxii TaxID=56418 RepID=UPI0034CF85F3